MKSIMLLFLLLVIYTISNAQSSGKVAKDTAIHIRICAPSRGSILVLVYSHNKILVSDTSTLSTLPDAAFKKVNVTTDTALIKAYGNIPRSGVLQVYLDDEKFPDAYKLFVKKDTIKRIKQ